MHVPANISGLYARYLMTTITTPVAFRDPGTVESVLYKMTHLIKIPI